MTNNPRVRNICFTLNNPTDGELQLERIFAESGIVQFGIWQLESGENNTRHVQGYLEFKNQVGFNRARSLLFGRAHIERRMGTQQQNIAYCSKEDTRLDGPFRFGEPKQQGERFDLITTMESIANGSSLDDLLEERDGNVIKYSRGVQNAIARRDRRIRNTPRPTMEVILLWGVAGAGKTSHVYEKYGYDKVYPLVTSQSGSVWFDGYEGEEILLIDDYRGWITFNFFLKVLDLYPLRLPVKGSFSYAAWTKVYITSNHPVTDWYREDSNHDLSALTRRIHRTYNFTGDGTIWLFEGADTQGVLVDSVEGQPVVHSVFANDRTGEDDTPEESDT